MFIRMMPVTLPPKRQPKAGLQLGGFELLVLRTH
jgi:hypothetical protein